MAYIGKKPAQVDVTLSAGSITAVEMAANSVLASEIAENAIGSSELANNAVTALHIPDNTITATHLPNGIIAATHLSADLITGAKIADDAIDSEHYTDGSIDTAHIAADAVTAAKLPDNVIDSEHYTDGSIDTAHIADLNITTAKIANNAITAAKLPDNVITATHIPNLGIAGSHIADDAIDSNHYADGSIDLAHMSANSIDSTQYVDGSIDLAHMSANSIDSAQYVDGSIDLAHMSANSVDSDQYVDGSIDAAHLAPAQTAITSVGTLTGLGVSGTAYINNSNNTWGRLNVHENSATVASLVLSQGSSSGNALEINSANTDGAGNLFKIAGTGNVTIASGDLTVIDNSKSFIIAPNSSDTLYYNQSNLGIRSGAKIYMQPGGSNYFTFKSNGNFGIGTAITDPTQSIDTIGYILGGSSRTDDAEKHMKFMGVPYSNADTSNIIGMYINGHSGGNFIRYGGGVGSTSAATDHSFYTATLTTGAYEGTRRLQIVNAGIIVTGDTDTDTLTVSGNATVGGTLGVTGTFTGTHGEFDAANATFKIINGNDNFYRWLNLDSDNTLYHYYNSTLIQAYSPSAATWDIRGKATHDSKITIDQNADDNALYIDSESANENALQVYGKYGLHITQDISAGRAAHFTRNLAEAGSKPLVEIIDDHTSNTQASLFIRQDGAGYGLEIDQNGNKEAIFITSDASSEDVLQVSASSLTTGRAGYFYSNSSSTGSRNLVEIRNDHASSSGTTALKVHQDGTGRTAFFNAATAADNRLVAVFEGQGNAGSTAAGGQYVAITRTGPISSSSGNICGGLLLGEGSNILAAQCGIRGTYEYTSGRDVEIFTSSDNTSAPTTKLWVMGSGKVGINTATPGLKLHIKDTAAYQLRLDGGSTNWTIGAGWSGYYAGYLLLGDTAAGIRMVIDSEGKVGIGTPTPAQELDVNGDIRISAAGGKLEMKNYYSPNNIASFQFANHWAGSEGLQIQMGDGNYWWLTDQGQIAFNHGMSTYKGVFLTNVGRVGIGIAGPATSLANTSTRIANADGLSVHLSGINWALNGQGYTAALSNLSSTNGNHNAGLLVELLTADATDKILDLESAGVNRVRVLGDGAVLVRGKVSVGATDTYLAHGYPAYPAAKFATFETVADTYAATFRHDGALNTDKGIAIICGPNNASGTTTAITILDGDGSTQGSVTFTGGTVTYGTFTANHDAELPDADNDSGYAYGTLVETTEIFYKQKDGADSERGILYKVQKSSSANSKAVLGVYSNKYSGEDNLHQIYVLGDGHILCNNSGGNIAVGDGICTSSVSGIGMKATVNPSMIIGIAQEAITFSGSETKLVPVQYGLQQFTPWS